jgi:branched-chain amino acid aminotransferase
MTGTAAHVTAVIEVDRRPVGPGRTGEVTARLQQLYFEAIRGNNGKYAHWVTPVKPQLAASERPAGREEVKA